jgi:hypothetical protein
MLWVVRSRSPTNNRTKGEYLLAVKRNQGRLHSALEKSFQSYESIERQDTGQPKSRLESCSYQVLNAVVVPEGIREQWPMLITIAVAISYRMTMDKIPSFELAILYQFG